VIWVTQITLHWSHTSRMLEVAMTDSSSAFVGSVPELYDRLLGPVLFEPYAPEIARRVSVEPGQAVLEAACGTGRLTHRLRERLPSRVRLVATDLNKPMINHARTRIGNVANLEWRVADCTSLPFVSSAFHALVCQFGLMFVADKATAIREAARVLADSGRLVFSVWDSLNRTPYAQVIHQTVGAFFPSDPPLFLEVPQGSADPEMWSARLREHGFSSIELEWIEHEAASPTSYDLASGFVRGTPLSHQISARGGDFERIAQAVGEALAQLGGAAPFRSPMRALIVSASRG
jgi:SAM-dependent methyltransferase